MKKPKLNTVVIPTSLKDKIKRHVKKSGHPSIAAFVAEAIGEHIAKTTVAKSADA